MGNQRVAIDADDLDYIRNIRDSGVNLYRAYDRILTHLPDTDPRHFWFQQASLINRQATGNPVPSDNNLASTYIITHSAYGLALDGISKDLGATSNAVASAVIKDILDDQGIIPPLDDMLGNDISRALLDGQQSIGGWGGSFYYWNLAYDGSTVGASILKDPEELEKFLLSSAVATLAVFKQELDEGTSLLEVLTVLNTAAGSTLPLALKEEIGVIVLDALHTGQVIANTTGFGRWTYDPAGHEFFRFENGIRLVASGQEATNLHARRLYRLEAEENGLDYVAEILTKVGIVDDYCFPAGTLITLWDGSCKAIEAIARGDTVLSFGMDGEQVGRTVTRLFRNVTQEWIELEFEDGREPLVVTPGHAFYDPPAGTYTPIERMLARGNGQAMLLDEHGLAVNATGRRIAYHCETAELFEQAGLSGAVSIGSLALAPCDGHGWVSYNFEVDIDHNYVAGGMRVHNDSLAVINAAGSVAAAFGSQLGRLLTAEENQFTQVLAGTALGTVTRNLAEVIVDTGYHLFDGSQFNFGTALGTALRQLEDIRIDFATAAAGTVSSLLIAELGESLGLEGFGADLFGIAAGAYAGSVLDLVAARALDTSFTGPLLSGTDFTSALSVLPGAVGTFFGSALAREILPAGSLQGQVGGSLGSIAGSALGTSLIGSALGQSLGLLGNFLLPGIGAFFGTIIGTFLGDLFGDDPEPLDPHATIDLFARTGLSIDRGGLLEVVSQYKSVDGFPHENTISWADAVRDISLEYLRTVGGFDLANAYTTGLPISKVLVDDFDFHPSELVRLLQQMRIEIEGDNAPEFYLDGARVGSAEKMVDGAIAGFVQDAQVIGGDMLIKRAAMRSTARDTPTLSGDMAAAEDYGRYLQSKELINAFMANNPGSTFAAGWVITLAKAGELELSKTSVSDFYGGLSGFLASLAHGGLSVQLSDVSISTGNRPGEIVVSIRVSNDIDIPGMVSVAADGFSVTEGDEYNTMSFVFENNMRDVGYNRPTATSAGTGGYLDVGGESAGRDLWIGTGSTAYRVVDSGNGTIRAGDAEIISSDDIFIGGDGADHIDGGEGWDWISGGGGNDRLFGGFKADVLFGGAGDDILNGGLDLDYLEGGAGADQLIGGGFGGLDADTAGYAGSDAAVTINLGTGAASGGHATGDTFNNILNIVGSAYDDHLTGNGNRNVLEGGAGADFLDGVPRQARPPGYLANRHFVTQCPASNDTQKSHVDQSISP